MDSKSLTGYWLPAMTLTTLRPKLWLNRTHAHAAAMERTRGSHQATTARHIGHQALVAQQETAKTPPGIVIKQPPPGTGGTELAGGQR